MNPQVQEKLVLDTVGPSRHPRIENLEKMCMKLKGGFQGPAGNVL